MAAPRALTPRLGARVRAVRRKVGLTQVQLAERMEISPSYLNLIEADKRPLPAELLLRLAATLQVDLASFAAGDDARLLADLTEVYADPVMEDDPVPLTELDDFAQAAPHAAKGAVSLFRAYQQALASLEAVASRLDESQRKLQELGAPAEGLPAGALDPTVGLARIPTEEVSDLLQRRGNHFPELEAAAEALWEEARLDRLDLYPGLVRHLREAHGVGVHPLPASSEPGVLRRFDPDTRTLHLSELLPTRSRLFQLAHTIGLLAAEGPLARIAADDALTMPESRALAKVAMANYYAGAVLMPYEPFLGACREHRYDLDVVGRRFRVSFEQVAHRMTTLRRPGAEGVPFHYLRIDVAGNISKRFSASGIRIARFSGACPRWNVFAAFLTPGMIRVQLSRMPDGKEYFCIARMIHKDVGGYHAQHPAHAIGLGCPAAYARELVYSDGVDLTNERNIVPVGVTCRICERGDCEQRAHPSLRQALVVDETVRRVSPYAPAGG